MTERPTEPIIITVEALVKWKPYKPNSEQYRKGIKGRWQKANEYGGWDNTDMDVDAIIERRHGVMTLPPLPTSDLTYGYVICPWCRACHDEEDVHSDTCEECGKDFRLVEETADTLAHWIGVRSEADEKYLAWEEGI